MRVYKKHTKNTYNCLIDSSINGYFIMYCFEDCNNKSPTFTSRDPLMNEKP